MVEFLTLFLGLTSGLHTVELSVAGQVATIEVQLDGEPLATLTEEPWTVDCDLGPKPLPHDLVAIARDADGEELDRAEQWINMASLHSAATLAVSSDADGQARALRVEWQSIGTTEPQQIEATFDGQPLDTTDPEHIPLPAHDGDDFHYASAAVEFSAAQSSRRETEFGGARTDKISTQLTAVVLDLEGRSRLPSVAKMRTWFLKHGEPLEIHGIEKGAMDLIVVRQPGAHAVLDALAKTALEISYKPGQGPAGAWRDWDPEHLFAGDPATVATRLRTQNYRLGPLREFAALNHQVRLRFISPRAGRLSPAGLEPEMFLHSRTYTGSEGGLSWLAQRQPTMHFAPRIGEAVSLAGMIARAGNRRRAVLLIATSVAPGASEQSLADTRELLRALQVPLYVWSVAASDLGWGEAIDLGDLAKPKAAVTRLQRATAALQRDLEDQRVVWLKGRHLPHQIELGAEAKGVRLSGS